MGVLLLNLPVSCSRDLAFPERPLWPVKQFRRNLTHPRSKPVRLARMYFQHFVVNHVSS